MAPPFILPTRGNLHGLLRPPRVNKSARINILKF